MFLIRLLECVYYDIKNPSRNTDRDRTRDLDIEMAYSLDEAKNLIINALARYGGVEKLQPKILTNNRGRMWIECDLAHRALESNGIVDIKCLAFEIQFKPAADDSDECNLKSFERVLGPAFFL